MKAEQKELYNFTKDHFINDLKRISPSCISPIIATRKVVKAAINKYINDYCSKGDNPFTSEDFQKVSKIIRDEVMKNNL